MDRGSGAVIKVAEGKHAAALDPFWKRLKHRRAQVEAVANLLDDGIKRAAVSGIQRLKPVANPWAAYRSGILAYYDFDRLATGPLEGTHNKINTLQKRAYGFRDKEFLKLKIKGLHETKYALVG